MHVCKIPHVPANDQPTATPLAPSAYLALRRKAAGYNIERLAKALVMVGLHGHDRPNMEELRAIQNRTRDLVALFERPGVVICNNDTLNLIESVMPFDPAVYRQLAEGGADRHPRICRSCGCSGHDPCITDNEVCQWITEEACSYCVERAADATQVAA